MLVKHLVYDNKLSRATILQILMQHSLIHTVITTKAHCLEYLNISNELSNYDQYGYCFHCPGNFYINSAFFIPFIYDGEAPVKKSNYILQTDNIQTYESYHSSETVNTTNHISLYKNTSTTVSYYNEIYCDILHFRYIHLRETIL